MQTKKLIHTLFFLFPAGLFFSVFIRFDGIMNGWIIPKVLYVILLAALMSLILAMLIAVRKKNVTLKLSLLDGFVLLFAAYLLVRSLLTPYLTSTNPYFIIIVALTGVYFFLRELFRRNCCQQPRRMMCIVFGCFLLVGLIQAGYGLLQLYGVLPSWNRYFKITGSFSNPNFYAGYLAIIMPAAAGVYLYAGKSRTSQLLKYLGAAAFLACLLALAATYTRAAWLAAAAGVSFVAGCRYHLWARFTEAANTAAKKVACSVAGLALLGATGVGLYILKPNSAYGRLFIWKITATRMVAKHPVFGIGFNRFKAEYNNEQAAYFGSGAGSTKEKRVAGNVQQAHNEYLQILTELGLIGLTLTGGVLYGLFSALTGTKPKALRKTAAQVTDVIRVSAAASLLAAGVLAVFSFPFHIMPTAILIVVLLALISALSRAMFVILFPFGKAWFRPSVSAFLILFSVAGFYYSYRTFARYKQWNVAVQTSFSDHQNKTGSLFKRLSPSFRNDGKFLFTWGSYETRTGNYAQAIPLLERARTTVAGPHLSALLGKCYEETKEYKKAEKSLKHAAAMRPAHLYPRYLLARLYRRSGQTQKALQTAKRVLHMKAKKGTMAARQIKTEMKFFLETANSSKQKQ